MNVALDAPKRPALRYYGGKWRLAPWIISFFPPHQNYVEPCGGAASVLLQKPRSKIETYNDLDGNVVNFFRVLRDRPDELICQIRLTPWARAEYEFAFWNTNGGDEVEQARRYFVAQWMGISSSTERSNSTIGWRVESSNFNGRIIHDINMFHSDQLYQIASRFKHVQIENLLAIEIIQKYDHPDTLFYLDPPYMMTEQRTKANWYEFDWKEQEHIEVAALLRECNACIVISGYASPLYKELYENYGWLRENQKSYVDQGQSRIESIWLNPRTVEKLAIPQQISFLQGCLQ